ncbi:hypothetical protein [Microbacterium hydrocarbonoxydans]|uniref:hypothetical protein n=1 Tax=Microbacterium hydrocarbonoxydans TaxID=273678 RepID=UPI00203C564F|nr:hypothetical protein [Microbacterium hydrocarbonoxydans]MCM3778400.1 hypothetical protein [Microbacterium hydrocarbonoxydans]
MAYIIVGVALFLWGTLTGCAGQKLSAVLAMIPVVGWFAVLAWFGWSGNMDSPTGDALPAYLLIGLLAFMVGSAATTRLSKLRAARRERQS